MKQAIRMFVLTGSLLLASISSMAATTKVTSCEFLGGKTATGVCEAPRTAFCNAVKQEVVCKGAGGSIPAKPVPKEKPKS